MLISFGYKNKIKHSFGHQILDIQFQITAKTLVTRNLLFHNRF